MSRTRAFALAAGLALVAAIAVVFAVVTRPIILGPHTGAVFLFNAGGRQDLYGWDGRLVRRDDQLPPDRRPAILSANGRYYVDTAGRVRSIDGTQVGSLTDWHHAEIGWSTDDQHLCEVSSSAGAYSLKVLDFQGKGKAVPLHSDGPVHDLYGCNVGDGRAAVLEGSGKTLALVSTSDGHAIKTMNVYGQSGRQFSPDVRWVASTTRATSGAAAVGITDLNDGHLRASIPGDVAVGFSPDGRVLVVNDSKAGSARAVAWESGRTVWSHPGRAEVIAVSDNQTNNILLQVTPAGPAFGGGSVEYWFVDGQGNGRRFEPLALRPSPSPSGSPSASAGASPAASPARPSPRPSPTR